MLDTYTGHRFYVKLSSSDSKVVSMFIVDENCRDISLSFQFPIIRDSIKTKTRRHPSVIDITTVQPTATSVNFKSLSSRDIVIWFGDSPGVNYQGTLHPEAETSLTAYLYQKFTFTEKGNKSNVISKCIILPDQPLYIVRDDKNHQPSQQSKEETEKRLQYMNEYLERTGIHWRHNFDMNGPRPPPVLHMWNAKEIGQTHEVRSANGYWSCNGPNSKCQSSDSISLELEVVSVAPKVFIIPDFLSDFEADTLIGIANKSVKHSTVGSADGGGIRSSETRTSRNTWIPRRTSALVDTLFRRAADAINVDEKLLHTNANVEDIQIVHYVNGQKYDSHHDWGVSGYHESRYITMLMYLTDQEDPQAGGETAFPKGGHGGGFKVKPVKGDAVLFYNLLEDGNGDDLALHAALPVWRGEKWLANFWVWDPKRK